MADREACCKIPVVARVSWLCVCSNRRSSWPFIHPVLVVSISLVSWLDPTSTLPPIQLSSTKVFSNRPKAKKLAAVEFPKVGNVLRTGRWSLDWRSWGCTSPWSGNSILRSPLRIGLRLRVSCIGKYFLIIDLASVLTPFCRIAFFQICGFFERTKYYAIWTLTEVCNFLLLRVGEAHVLSRVLASLLVLGLLDLAQVVNHSGNALPMSTSFKSSLHRTSRSCSILGTWKPMFGCASVCTNVSRLLARSPVSKAACLHSQPVHSGYVLSNQIWLLSHN